MKRKSFRVGHSRLSRLFYPEVCSGCGKIIPYNYLTCPYCYKNEIEIGERFCRHCAKDLSCCNCADPKAVYLPEVTAAYLYSGDIREKLLRFKFRGVRRYAKFLSQAMAQRVNQVYGDVSFDGVCFVPMTSEAVAGRGFNQSQLLAEGVAARLRLPVCFCLEKVRETQKQHDIDAEMRKHNLKGAISVKGDVKGKRLLLCDDIKTTGNTLRECVNVLLEAGAEKVYCVCAAVSDYDVKR